MNSQGSRKAKELLLADDYDGLVQVAEDQVEGGAHVLDVCVALTERQDEDEQMRQTVKRISLTQPAPIQVDSTEPDVIRLALEQIPGRAIVNSVNLEAGPDKLNVVAPLAVEHGAALIALTIDEVGMAKTAERKVEVARRIAELCDVHGLERELLVFDVLTFTLTTGDEEWRPSAVETIEGIRRLKEELPGVKTSLGVSNVSFGVSPGARAVLNSVFLHHAVEAGLDLAMVNPNHITPYGEIGELERALADDLVFNRREDALERFIAHFESKGAEEEAVGAGDPTEGMEPEEALHFHILRRKRDGVEDWIDRSVEKIGAVPTLNEVLLPAMKEVGDKFGAGELILPFVLQSAEVMKRAVARLENYLDRIEGYTKGTVVLATVFGDVHDIGKSLVNTILTNNGYTVVDLGKQVPISTIIDAAKEHEATAIGLSALLVSTSKQMPACIQELHAQGLDYPVLIGGAAINRDFGLRALYPGGRESDDVYGAGVFFCKDAFEGLAKMDAIVEPERREELVRATIDAAQRLRLKGPEPEALPTDDDSVRSAARTDVPVPTPPWWGVRELEVDQDELFHHLDTHVLFKLHWGGRGVKGEAWQKLLREDFQPRLERMWREQDYLRPRALLGYFPCYSEGNDLVVLDPEDRETELTRLREPAPARPRPHLPVRLLPLQGERRARRRRAAGGHRGLRGHRPHGAPGGRRRVRRAALRPRARRPDRRGPGRVRPRPGPPRPGDRAGAGAPLLVGVPGGARAVRAREGRRAAGPLADRHDPLGRLRARARAVDAGDRRAPPAGDLLRHEVRLPAQERAPGRRRGHRRQRPRPDAGRPRCPTRIRPRPARSRPRARSRGRPPRPQAAG